MKNAILTAVLVMGFSANASWYQEHCSNAEGTVKLADGHNENYIQLTERRWDQGQMNETVLRDREGKLKYDVASEQQIERRSDNSCQQGNKQGMASWSAINLRKLIISKEDGTLFSENTVGVSSDLRTVETFVVCELKGNSQMLCQEK